MGCRNPDAAKITDVIPCVWGRGRIGRALRLFLDWTVIWSKGKVLEMPIYRARRHAPPIQPSLSIDPGNLGSVVLGRAPPVWSVN